jgi:hypothetical protein
MLLALTTDKEQAPVQFKVRYCATIWMRKSDNQDKNL